MSKPENPSAWQPIETAPKDGTEITVICMGAPAPRPGSAWWHYGVWTTLRPEGGYDARFYRSSIWGEPTHWKPSYAAYSAAPTQKADPA